ncbi:hypothetical protein Bp8pS_256 [Bacillus phage vB_BpuM-BpSp]|nr:hypothetical protein Bp8pS_256 [Bacillus phage vB_BpuM-BpSp]
MDLNLHAVKESDINTITEKGSLIFTEQKNLYILSDSRIKITDTIIIDKESDLTNNKIENKLILVKENKTIYIYIKSSNKFEKVSNGASKKDRIKIEPYEGQTRITYPIPLEENNILLLLKNGVLLEEGIDYTKYSSIDFDLKTPLEKDLDYINIIIL